MLVESHSPQFILRQVVGEIPKIQRYSAKNNERDDDSNVSGTCVSKNEKNRVKTGDLGRVKSSSVSSNLSSKLSDISLLKKSGKRKIVERNVSIEECKKAVMEKRRDGIQSHKGGVEVVARTVKSVNEETNVISTSARKKRKRVSFDLESNNESDEVEKARKKANLTK